MLTSLVSEKCVGSVAKKLPEYFQNLTTQELFKKLYDLTYPADADLPVENCWDYVITPDTISDQGYALFIFNDNESEILIGGRVSGDFAVRVSLKLDDCLKLITSAHQYACSF